MIVIGNILELLCTNVFLTGYISGNNTFPQPLDEKEEQKYLELLKAGDKKAKGVLIERNLRLVAHIVKKYQIPNKDIDELISIGTVGLIKAIDSFDASKGTRLATYASRCIENEILMLFRSSKKQKGETFLHDPIGVDKEGNEISLIDVLSSDKDSVIDKVETNIQIKALYSKINTSLNEREGEIIKMRYGLIDGKCKTQREIASLLGISRSYVSRIEKRALTKLLREFVKNKNFEKILLASQEKIVYACLSLRPKHIEELMEETGISLPELTNLLFDMEMKHYIKQPLKNYFIIRLKFSPLPPLATIIVFGTLYNILPLNSTVKHHNYCKAP